MDDVNRTIEATKILFTQQVQGVKVPTIMLRQGRIKRLTKFQGAGYLIKTLILILAHAVCL